MFQFIPHPQIIQGSKMCQRAHNLRSSSPHNNYKFLFIEQQNSDCFENRGNMGVDVCVYVSVYIYIYIYICACAHKLTYIFLSLSLSLYIYIYICNMYVYIYIYIYICLYMYTYIYILIYIHVMVIVSWFQFAKFSVCVRNSHLPKYGIT